MVSTSDKRQDGGLQARQRPTRAVGSGLAPVAPRGDRLDVLGRLGATPDRSIGGRERRRRHRDRPARSAADSLRRRRPRPPRRRPVHLVVRWRQWISSPAWSSERPLNHRLSAAVRRRVLGGRSPPALGRASRALAPAPIAAAAARSLSAWLGSACQTVRQRDAADLAPVRRQACQLHIVGGRAGRADDQHRRISSARHLCRQPYSPIR